MRREEYVLAGIYRFMCFSSSPLIHIDSPIKIVVDIKIGSHSFARCLPEATPEARLVQQLDQCFSERLGITRRHQQTANALLDDLSQTSNIGRDYRCTKSH